MHYIRKLSSLLLLCFLTSCSSIITYIHTDNRHNNTIDDHRHDNDGDMTQNTEKKQSVIGEVNAGR
ncbi:hypothetical protein [Vibrio mediterranei]|uniref:hypothetical protein n=1 Tax=Vibrio mediterranei TaxID=689 RepID=UPI002283A424|nr:hypothetical protein [Vibrio mediterranei]MCY9855825.1 hypothetical protein [Vibrio mediterranei]